MGSRIHPRCFRGLLAEDSYEQWMNGDVICGDDHPGGGGGGGGGFGLMRIPSKLPYAN